MKSFNLFIVALVVILLTSCKKDDPSEILVESFSVSLSSQNAVPGIGNRNETGIAELQLFEDNSLKFDIAVDNLSSSDNLTASHIHIGDVLSTGGVLVGLVNGTDISFSGGIATGTISLNTDQVTSLRAKDKLYINVHSEQAPSGLVRGQIGTVIDQAYNIALTSSVNGRDESGVAYLRVIGNTLQYKLEVNDLSSMDQIVASHIHEGATGVNGGVLIGFEIESNDDLGVVKQVALTTIQINALPKDPLYINVHSAQEQAGLIRGQIRG